MQNREGGIDKGAADLETEDRIQQAQRIYITQG